MSTKANPLPRARSAEVIRSNRSKAAMPGLGALSLDAEAQYFYTTNLVWNSTATVRTTFPPIPFNFQIADIFTVLKIAPVDNAADRFRVGTATDDDLFFVTGNAILFNSVSITASAGSVVRRTTATNAINLTGGTAGMQLRVTLPPTTGQATTTDGSLYGILVVVPRA